ncbi:MAG: tRNA 2-thiouridine(34) synthase MnmA [candidate division WOR-3 bacterium]|nr:tRNA 2-thiouridine(34) synthase MnmA [candidate division WOR-3 bacterium]
MAIESAVRLSGLTRVLVAMSGGVDSSVAAALLKEQGFDVVGVTMRLYDDERTGEGGRGCCGFSGSRDAARVAARLGFPHYTWDFRKEFGRMVIDDFCAEYGRGRTPNPCLRCNEQVKFTELLARAAQLGAERIATGHYARIDRDPAGVWQLRRGVDAGKDQSYFLYAMTQEQLSRVLMPVGGYTKTEVRALARKLELPVAEKPESQDICFVPENDYGAFLRKQRPELFRPGPVLDMAGRVLGQHEGIAGFTIGQRRGLGLAFGERRYVIRLDPEKNAVVLGTEKEAYGRVVEAGSARWVSGKAPVEPLRAQAKVRYQGKGGKALVEPRPDGRVRVTFDEPQWAPTPGQAVVFWQDDCVLGGATIA